MQLPPAARRAALVADAAGACCPPAAAGRSWRPRKICAQRLRNPSPLGSAQWNGWGRDLDNTRYQPEPAIRASDVAKLALKWAFGYQGGTEFGQPTVVDGRLFVDEFGRPHLLARCQNRLHLLDL